MAQKAKAETTEKLWVSEANLQSLEQTVSQKDAEMVNNIHFVSDSTGSESD